MATETILVMLTVPTHWKGLSEEDLVRRLQQNEPNLSQMVAAEIRAWSNKNHVDLGALARFLKDRGVEA